MGLTLLRAAEKACEERTLRDALVWIAVWETERVVKQALEYKKTGISTASHGGGWDTCFGICFDTVFALWKKKKKPRKLKTKKPKYRKCKEHPEYEGSFMPLGRGCAQCYLIWYICGQRRNKRKEESCQKKAGTGLLK